MKRLFMLLFLPVVFAASAWADGTAANGAAASGTAVDVEAYLMGADRERAFETLYNNRNSSVPEILGLIEKETDAKKRAGMQALVERINYQRNLEQDTVLGMLTNYALKDSHFYMVLVLSAALFIVIVDLVRRKLLRIEYSWAWALAGVGILFLVLTRLLDAVADLIGARVPQALFFMGVLFLTLINLHYSVAISRLSNQTKNLSQELAVLKNELETALEAAEKAKSPE